jgi:hypothetical protein
MLTGLTFAAEANAITRIDAGRDFNGQGFLLLNPAMTMTLAAGRLDDIAAAMATGTGLLQGKEALLHSDLTMAAAG